MKLKIYVMLLAAVFLTRTPVFAQARVADITITNTRYDLELVYLNLKGTFTEKMQEAVLSGVPTTFLFFITLEEVRSIWADKELVEITLSHTIKYHSLKKEFVIKRSWEDDKPIVAQSFKESQKLMNEINNLNIISLDKLEKGKQYRLRAKAQLSKLTLPLHLHYILFFVSLWDFETDWYSIDFVY